MSTHAYWGVKNYHSWRPLCVTLQAALVNKHGKRTGSRNLTHNVGAQLHTNDRLTVGGAVTWPGQDLTTLSNYPADLVFFRPSVGWASFLKGSSTLLRDDCLELEDVLRDYMHTCDEGVAHKAAGVTFGAIVDADAMETGCRRKPVRIIRTCELLEDELFKW